jgi:hypothetical protein
MPSQLIFTTEGSAPATPGSGTVSVYTKTSDKRLYYKDDTGTEIGPLNTGGSGTVTDVSVTTANGVSGSVATSTTTPAISLTLGAITPTSVNGNVLATGSGTKTFPTGTTTIAAIDKEQTFTAQQVPMTGALTDGATINWDADVSGQVVSVTTAASRTFAAPTNIIQNALYSIVITTGGFTPSWNAAYKWAGAVAPSSLTGVCIFMFIGGASNTLLSTGYQANVS